MSDAMQNASSAFSRLTSREQVLVVVFVLATTVLLQTYSGHIFLIGTGGVAFAYLLGAALCIVLGATWQQGRPGQPLTVLFTAVLIAGFLTIGLMLSQ